MPQMLTEARKVCEATAVADKPGKFKIQLITPGWGSSGYYSEAVLKKAAESKIFPAGTRMNLDHQTWAESQERPEGTVLNWAATLTEDAYWDGNGLAAEAEVYAPYAAVLNERKNFLGVSIRASADFAMGEAEGRKGRIVEELLYGDTVDFVTAAGRGGKVLAVLESARNLATEATSGDRRDQLQRAVTTAYTDREAETYAWVRDFDEALSVVYFELNDERTYAQTYEVGDNDQAALAGEPSEVRVVTSFVPVTAAANENAPTPTNVPANPAGHTSQENHMATIDDQELVKLRESAGRVSTLEAERDAEKARADKAEADKAEAAARESATERARTNLKDSGLPAVAVDRIVRESVRSLPMKDGALDVTAFDAAVTSKQTEEASYLASVVPSGSHVTGFGASNSATESAATERPNPWSHRYGSTVKGA